LDRCPLPSFFHQTTKTSCTTSPGILEEVLLEVPEVEVEVVGVIMEAQHLQKLQQAQGQNNSRT
jgi:hypothetical protein